MGDFNVFCYENWCNQSLSTNSPIKMKKWPCNSEGGRIREKFGCILVGVVSHPSPNQEPTNSERKLV